MIPRGRYAPSPTGALHLGNAATALAAWLSVRARGGALVLRVEDLDGPRAVPGAEEAIRHDLRWLGLDWDEGDDVGGPHAPYAQSRRKRRYDAAFARLRASGRVYPCFCSRRDVAAAASAPQAPGDEPVYPGTCRDLPASEIERRIAAGRAPAWRLRGSDTPPEAYDDLVRGRLEPPAAAQGDFVVRRADGTAAYQLAVVVDDAAMQITEVVRGGDLVPSTFRQLVLYATLGYAVPRFGHVPLFVGEDGVRLSKRHRGISIAELRAAGRTGPEVVGAIAFRLGLLARERPATPRELVERFDLALLRRAPREIPVTGA